MKYKKMLFLILLVSFDTYASQTFPVILRQERSNRTYFAQKEMPDLVSADTFNGKYFKVVNGKSNEAISFHDKDEDLILKAASVYYHLSLARNYWVNVIKSSAAQALPKTVVRLNLVNQFDDLGHYAHDNRAPQFNNALSVPEGKTPSWVPEDKQEEWGKEIWYRPMKSISTKELGSLGPNPITVGIMALDRPLINYLQNQFSHRLMEEFFYPSYVSRPLYEDVIRYAGTYAIMKVILEGSKLMDNLFVEKYYYLDTAMVPEVTYHEYSHVVLSDTLKMSHSTPVNEGMADYFAAVISKKRKVYGKVSGYSNSRPKDTQEKRKYSHWDESNRLATSDFTLSVLWDVRETLGEEIGDQVIYQAREYLKTESSTISHGLLRAILNACDLKCEQPRRDKYMLYETFTMKGF